jgi:hypothetical protein
MSEYGQGCVSLGIALAGFVRHFEPIIRREQDFPAIRNHRHETLPKRP